MSGFVMEANIRYLSPDIEGKIPKEEWSLTNFSFQQMLQKGYSASVMLFRHIKTGTPVVFKMYDVLQMNVRTQQQVRRETKIHTRLNHPNIIKVYAVFSQGAKLVIALEFAERGDLFTVMSRPTKMYATIGDLVEKVFKPLMAALEYIHRLGYIHRDIKPENLFVALDGQIKLGDFGLAIDALEERPLTRVGTVEFMAPEVAALSRTERTEHYNSQVDVWSFGILLRELVQHSCSYYLDHTIFRDFVDKCLNRLPCKRFTMQQLQAHEWLDEFHTTSPN